MTVVSEVKSSASELGDAPEVASERTYAPSPVTCSQALDRAQQVRIQSLLRQLLSSKDPDRLDIIRMLRKQVDECQDHRLSWIVQVDLIETIDRIMQEDELQFDTDWRVSDNCVQLLVDLMQKHPDQLQFEWLAYERIVAKCVENLGHRRSELRRSSLLLLNLIIIQRPEHFQQVIRVLVNKGLANHSNEQSQRGAILSLPLLLNSSSINGQNLGPLIKCLGEMLVSSNSRLFYSLYLAMRRLEETLGAREFDAYLQLCSSEVQSLYKQAASRNNSLSMQAIDQTPQAGQNEPIIRATKSPTPPRKPQPEVDFNVSVKARQPSTCERSNTRKVESQERDSASTEAEELDSERVDAPEVAATKRQVSFGDQKQDESEPEVNANEASDEARRDVDELMKCNKGKDTEQQGSTGLPRAPGGSDAPIRKHTKPQKPSSIKRKQSDYHSATSSVSSTCSSEANLVDPSHYMSESALNGHPLDAFKRQQKIHRQLERSKQTRVTTNGRAKVALADELDDDTDLSLGDGGDTTENDDDDDYDYDVDEDDSAKGCARNRTSLMKGNGSEMSSAFAWNDNLAINQLNVSCSPAVEMGASAELKFGIFPRHLVSVALNPSRSPSDRANALNEIMCIMRDSPVNHLAILISYFSPFIDQFLASLLGGHPQQGAAPDAHCALVAVDMIETLVVKTKLSTLHYVRPLVRLLVRAGLAETRTSMSLVRENSIRVVHKLMGYLPPQHVIDALIEHKHHLLGQVREEVVNRITGAILEFDRNEFNLTKLCYHVLPMLADQQAFVRMASLECIAALAQALGPERIGTLLTAAEAVQSGCDYDNLMLEAINARLSRRMLPRCNSDGSIRHVIRPFVVSRSPNCATEQQVADVRWVLEAPSSHHLSDRQSQVHHQHQHHHSHRPGAYSPDSAAAHLSSERRRSLVGSLTQLEPEAQHPHHHAHHAHHGHEHEHDKKQLQHKDDDDDDQDEDGGEPNSNASDRSTASKTRRRSNVAFASTTEFHNQADTNNNTKRPSTDHELVKTENGQQLDTKSENPNHRKPSAEHKLISSRPLGSTKQKNRSDSRDSTSSMDSNKVLFQYYLHKFKDSLSESAASGGISRSVLPSDSMIYSDAALLYEQTRHKSIYQQTSFDYDSDSVGKIPTASSGSSKPRHSCSNDNNNNHSGQPNPATLASPSTTTTRKQSLKQVDASPVTRETTTTGSDTGSESPQTMVERINPKQPQKRSQSVHVSQPIEPARSKKLVDEDVEPQRLKASERRRSSVGLNKHFASETDKASLPSKGSQDSDSAAGSVVSSCRQRHQIEQRKGSVVGDQATQQEPEEQELNETQSDPTKTGGNSENDATYQERQSRRESLANRRRSSRSECSRRTPQADDIEDDDHRPRGSKGEVDAQIPASQTTLNGQRRAQSLSPANSSVNITQILESVARLEGAFQEPHLAMRVALDALDGSCWSTKVEGILALVRLFAYHQPIVIANLHEIVGRLAAETRSLRSTVARSAIYALGDLVAKLGHQVESHLDTIVRSLLARSTECASFIRDDIRKSLGAIANRSSQWKFATLLIQHGSNHKSSLVRRMTSHFVSLTVRRMGAAKCLVGARDIGAQLLPAAARFAQDPAPQTRYHGRLCLSILMQHTAFDRLMRKYLTPGLYRSTIGVVENVRRRGAGEQPSGDV